MPVKMLPGQEEFAQLKKWMLENEFKLITNEDFHNNFRRLGLVAPRKKYGRETGFYFSHPNGLTAYVWTTYVEKACASRDEDAGWVLITEGDKALYFTHPLHRTKGFIPKLINYAWIAKRRVIKRPTCHECGRYMSIHMGKGIGARYWKCINPQKHAKSVRENWDVGMTQKAIAFLNRERKVRKQYRTDRRKQGLSVGLKRIQRKKWTILKPENRRILKYAS